MVGRMLREDIHPNKVFAGKYDIDMIGKTLSVG